MRIAVIGAGVSGLGAAFALKDRHDVILYEKADRLGGHANTVTVDYDGAHIAVDTGFIVYNQGNYPNLTALFGHLGVETRQTDMCFAFAGPGLEWCSNFPRGVFAQKRNLLRPGFLQMLNDIKRFNMLAKSDLAKGRLADMTLGAYLRLRRFCKSFEQHYLMPMGAAIWSTTGGRMADFPAESFVRFFANHGLLEFQHPKWRTVVGGSKVYVEAIARELGGRRIRCGAGEVTVRRRPGCVVVRDAHGGEDVFDQVVLAGHSDENLRILADADAEERALLGAIRFSPNRAVLHRDPSLMPERRFAWGSWNYMATSPGEPASVTYWMNQLQGLDKAKPLFVSLNPSREPDPALTFAAFDYDHPQFDGPALAAQRGMNAIQGRGGVWHAGAWLGFGFHEDGLTAGLRAGLNLGGGVPWSFVDHRIPGGPLPAPLIAPRLEAA